MSFDPSILRPRPSANFQVPNTIRPPRKPVMEIYHLDPGSAGDTTIVDVVDHDEVVLIDCATEAAAERLKTLLQHKFVGKAIISHFDKDHFSGLVHHLAGCRAVEVYTPVSNDDVQILSEEIPNLRRITEEEEAEAEAEAEADENMEEERKEVHCSGLTRTQKRVRSEEMNPGKAKDQIKALLRQGHLIKCAENIDLGAVRMHLLEPPNQNAAVTLPSHENSNSLKWMICHDGLGFYYYTAGDAEDEGVPLSATYRGRVSAFKMSHHGGNTGQSNGAAFLNSTGAKAAIVLGPGGMHGHPSDNVLRRAMQAGIRTYSTGHYSSAISDTDIRNNHTICGSRQGMGDICLTLYDDRSFEVAWLTVDGTLAINRWQIGSNAMQSHVYDANSWSLMSAWQRRLWSLNHYLHTLPLPGENMADMHYRATNYDQDNNKKKKSGNSRPAAAAGCHNCSREDFALCEKCGVYWCSICWKSEEHVEMHPVGMEE